VAAVAPARTVKAKKRCCKDSPRCKRCPVVLKRLANGDLAERRGKRAYVVWADRAALRAARKR
jgi:hypothetical protein